MKTLAFINPDNIPADALSGYRTRQAVRAVVFDDENNVAVLHVSKNSYYKLPGGGIEEGEEKTVALRRECREEIGSDIEVVSEIGEIMECRPKFTFLQTSYCYIAKLAGRKGESSFTESEVGEGFEEAIWVPLAKALDLVSRSNPTDYNGPFIKERDTLILKTVSEIIASDKINP